MPGHHHKAGSPNDLAADDEQQQAANVRRRVQQFRMCGRFRQVEPGQRDERQRVKRSGARAKETVVKANAAAGDQGKRQAIQTALPVLFAELRHQQKIEADTDNQNGQYLLKNVGLNVLNQQRAAGRAEKGHQNIQLLIGQIHHLAANEIQRSGQRPAAGLQLVGGQRLRRGKTRRHQGRNGQ